MEEAEIPELIISLLSCEDAKRGVGPKTPAGDIIQKCCLNAEGEEDFQGCLGKCYLEEGYKKYKECLHACLETKSEEIIKCRHRLNFYCCQL